MLIKGLLADLARIRRRRIDKHFDLADRNLLDSRSGRE
jgi:hypothetical protein